MLQALQPLRNKNFACAIAGKESSLGTANMDPSNMEFLVGSLKLTVKIFLQVIQYIYHLCFPVVHSLRGEIAVVTGGGSGIGRSVLLYGFVSTVLCEQLHEANMNRVAPTVFAGKRACGWLSVEQSLFFGMSTTKVEKQLPKKLRAWVERPITTIATSPTATACTSWLTRCALSTYSTFFSLYISNVYPIIQVDYTCTD